MKGLVKPNNLNGDLYIPGSKSHTIRALVIATLAEGKSIIKNPLKSQDCLSALKCCEKYGAKIKQNKNNWEVIGTSGKLSSPDNVIDVGNSGTTMYFITAMAGLINDWSVITGDESIRTRPIKTLLDALNDLGAEAFTTRKSVDVPPAVIKGEMTGGSVKFKGNFSQYISAVLIAAPMIKNGLTKIEVDEPKEKPYLQITLDWLTENNIEVDYDNNYKYFEVPGNQQYSSFCKDIPGDWSSVAFPLVAGVITNSNILIKGVDFSDSQGDKKIIDIMIEMGAKIDTNIKEGIIQVKGGKSSLKGIDVDCSDVPDLLPILSVASCFAEGKTTLKNVEMVRVKETDRVEVMKNELEKLGAKVEASENEMVIYNSDLHGAKVESHDDHRIAMALMVAGLKAKNQTEINGIESASVSFPNFIEKMNALNANIETY